MHVRVTHTNLDTACYNFLKSFCFVAVFIYSMPGYNCPVKERMLYTSCLSPLIGFLGESLGIEIAKRVSLRKT